MRKLILMFVLLALLAVGTTPILAQDLSHEEQMLADLIVGQIAGVYNSPSIKELDINNIIHLMNDGERVTIQFSPPLHLRPFAELFDLSMFNDGFGLTEYRRNIILQPMVEQMIREFNIIIVSEASGSSAGSQIVPANSSHSYHLEGDAEELIRSTFTSYPSIAVTKVGRVQVYKTYDDVSTVLDIYWSTSELFTTVNVQTEDYGFIRMLMLGEIEMLTYQQMRNNMELNDLITAMRDDDPAMLAYQFFTYFNDLSPKVGFSSLIEFDAPLFDYSPRLDATVSSCNSDFAVLITPYGREGEDIGMYSFSETEWLGEGKPSDYCND